MLKNIKNQIILLIFSFIFYFAFINSKDINSVNINEQLLVISLMVKDEEHVMVDTLSPFIKAGIKYFLVYDTGSKDNTVNITKKYFEDNKIKDYFIIQEDFKDFASSRNRALDLTQEKFSNAKFILMPDAEWYIKNCEKLLDFCRINQNNKASCYLIKIFSSDFSFYTARLFKNHSKVRFEGAVHECLNYCTNIKIPDEIYFDLKVSFLGAKKTSERFHRDLRLLLNSFINDPTNCRTAFYLAQTYQCLGDIDNALKFYNFRIKLNRLDEEHYECHYRIARIMEEQLQKNLIKNWQDVLNKYLEAYSLRPHRIEPLIRISEYYLNHNNMTLAFLFVRPTFDMKYPEHDTLFVEQYLYQYTRYEILSRCAWYVGQFEIGELACRKALEFKPEFSHLHNNLNFYIKRKRSS